MKRVVALAFLATTTAAAKPPAPRTPPPPPPAAPLAMLPSVARIKVTTAGGQLVVTEDLTLPRGEWKGEPIDLWVSFGAPGVPKAMDAHLLAIADGALEAPDLEAGDALAMDRAPRRPATANPLLGRDSMAGVVVHLKKDQLAKAFGPSNMAALRLRTALDLPEDDPSGQKSVLVRLGASRGTPLTLARVVFAIPKLTKAEVHLCGADADSHALAFSPRLPSTEPRIAPVLATRHGTDDLCIRFATEPP